MLRKLIVLILCLLADCRLLGSQEFLLANGHHLCPAYCIRYGVMVKTLALAALIVSQSLTGLFSSRDSNSRFSLRCP